MRQVVTGWEEEAWQVVGLEEQFDLHKDWRLMPRSDKPDRFSLNRIRNAADGANVVTFKAENKGEGGGLAPMPGSHAASCLPFPAARACCACDRWIVAARLCDFSSSYSRSLSPPI